MLAAAFPSADGGWKICLLAPTPQTPLSLLTSTTRLSAVKEKLRLDPDSEIATTGVRVSLICPVSPGARVLCPHLPAVRRRWGGHSRHPLAPRSW